MPRPRKIAKQRRPDLGPWIEKLKFGYCLLNNNLNAMEDEAFRPAWEEHRASILEGWIRERPGSRPWGWWAFEAPENHHLCGRERDYLDAWGCWAKGERRRAGAGP